MKATVRFLARVDRSDPDACWPWTVRPDPNGYGRFWLNGHMIGAHRASYLLFVGPIPAGMDIDHLCHEATCRKGMACPHRRCVNPAHLAPATRRDNLLRGDTIAAAKVAGRKWVAA